MENGRSRGTLRRNCVSFFVFTFSVFLFENADAIQSEFFFHANLKHRGIELDFAKDDTVTAEDLQAGETWTSKRKKRRG
jgi:hypothetical protein